MANATMTETATATPPAKRRGGNSQFAMAMRQFRRNKLAVAGLIVLTIIVLACIFQNWLTPYHYAQTDLQNTFAPLSLKHPFGTDQMGRDLLTRILKGGQLSLLIGGLSVLLAATAGTILGATAAFFGGAYRSFIMRLMDVLLSIPALMMAAAVSTALGSGIFNSILAIGLAQVATMTRMMYSTALSVRSQEYLEAAKASGASNFRIVMKYVVPNCIAPIIVQTTLRLGTCITQIASLSFLGLGVTPPTPEWGSILSAGRQFIRAYWPIVTFPGIAIALTLISVNLIGDGLRDAFDPRLKR